MFTLAFSLSFCLFYPCRTVIVGCTFLLQMFLTLFFATRAPSTDVHQIFTHGWKCGLFDKFRQ